MLTGIVSSSVFEMVHHTWTSMIEVVMYTHAHLFCTKV
jgi:hypothetical protein